ncbi:MAG: fumarylacetoacetate hydrolase family protein [Acidimicrobiaceae bacterium]|jgi:2-keto-4-pentenoate hydratase/2-oxohepta-3-ene-1,7-dioic acid hydratase in catechol pathway|nr:fumarylacetoacetate hydrolase family protein [Acidimicrobiaceae bacterium]MDB4103717.1 fumarylacetoacetate hydrolase family protein [Acidimicrobiales bacterium]MDB4205663.1 fumarylacetoacetate hydrolase family protein [bacterium]MDC1390274.1 fumarylacetoacetate hydrolase family protein [Acidimicrobiales bacterium]MDG1087196.1 fumarylacetoacetate hydrolase family protein [Acidimicrobiales bacterium]
MRFLGFDVDGVGSIGLVDGAAVRRLCTIDEFYGDLDHWRNAEASGDPIALDDITRVPPVPQTAKVLCLGLNYAAHISETGSQRPDYPNIFAKWYASLSSHGDEVPVPTGDDRFDWECEMAVIIGAPLTDTAEADAMDGVLGYTCFNDISARGYQRRTHQWAIGKNPDRSAPIGPVVVTADEFGDPYGKRISTRVNGETRQDGTTDMMLFKIAETIEYITAGTSLRPGDVIATGTPSGVGDKMDPPTYLTAGDTVEIEIEDIGVLQSRIVARG